MSDDCACLYGGYDGGDDCRFTTTSIVTARKVHQCCECQETIAVGAKHQKVTQLYEGRFDTYRTCLVCVEIAAALYCQGEGRYWEMLWEDVRDQIFDQQGLTIACLDKLSTVAAKEKLSAAYRSFLGVK